MRSEEKKNIIKNDYGIEMTKIVERSVGDMCSLGTGIYLEGARKGEINKCLIAIKKIMKKFDYTEEQAMNVLDLSEKEKVMYSELLKKEITV